MPTVTKGEVYPHIGAVWKRMVELWELWLADSTLTWALNAGTSYLGRPAVLITLTAGADVQEFYLVDYGMPNSGGYAPDLMLAAPGWTHMPKAFPPTIAGRTVSTEFNSKLVAARKQLWINKTNAFSGSFQDFGGYALPGLSATVRMQYLAWRYECRLGTDMVTMTTYTATANDTIPGDVNLAHPISMTNVVTLGGGGGGEVDLAPLTLAVQDLVHRDVVTILDNGNISVWMFSGDIVEP